MSITKDKIIDALYRSYLLYVFSMLRFVFKKSALHKVGWFKSCRHRESVDQNGEPIPWMTYSVIYFLEQRLNKSMTVYEYGSGNSTVWWSKKVQSVIACEHNKGWYALMKKNKTTNVKIKYVELDYGGKYSRAAVSESRLFDIIVIDGRDRSNCAKESIRALTRGGVIIWDNTNRPRYKEGCDWLIDKGFKRLDFFGMAPIDNANSLTTIFYKDKNCLGI